MATVPNRYLPGDYAGSTQRHTPVGYGRRGNPFYSESAYRQRHGGHLPTDPTQQPLNRPSRTNRQAVIHRAVGRVSAALQKANPDMSRKSAAQYAKEILTHVGADGKPLYTLGRGGSIFFRGQKYSPAQIAGSTFAQRATGAFAQKQNEAAISGDPGYLQAMANLGLSRDQSVAGLQDQQRQALIEFGDPTFAGTDAQTAAEAAVNPFSTTRLQAQQYAQQQQAARSQANRLGTAYGGGLESGLSAAQQSYAGQVQDTAAKLEALLGAINTQQAGAQQAYDVGQQQARMDAYNALLASGAIHAATPPKWAIGTYAVKGYGGVPSGGGQAGHPPAPPPPGGATPQWPTPIWQAGGGGGLPSAPRPGLPGAPIGGAGGHMPPATYGQQQPLDTAALLRRYGVG